MPDTTGSVNNVINVNIDGPAAKEIMTGIRAINTDLWDRISGAFNNLVTDPHAVTMYDVISSTHPPSGAPLHFYLGDVNDEADLTYGGYGRTVSLNGRLRRLDDNLTVQHGGRNTMFLVSRNVPCGDQWYFTFKVTWGNTPVFDLIRGGDDSKWPSGRIRIYRLYFDAA